ncbi:MAG: DHH family phosphoesterase [Owenweeksia sp.]|nr:DHH family phosphoesterase [Owenweeksia sp.]
MTLYESTPDEGDSALGKADLVIHLDYNSLSRSGKMKESLKNSTAKKLVVDHHQQPEDFADVLYSDPGMSSTCEMVFHLLEGIGYVVS